MNLAATNEFTWRRVLRTPSDVGIHRTDRTNGTDVRLAGRNKKPESGTEAMAINLKLTLFIGDISKVHV